MIQTKQKKQKKMKRDVREKEREREVYCYSGITVLACTTNVHCPVYGATRYPLSPSEPGSLWRPVLSQHPLPPVVTQSLRSHNLQHNCTPRVNRRRYTRWFFLEFFTFFRNFIITQNYFFYFSKEITTPLHVRNIFRFDIHHNENH